MRFVELIAASKLEEAKQELFAHLSSIVEKRFSEAKKYVAADNYEEIEELDEAIKRNPISSRWVESIVFAVEFGVMQKVVSLFKKMLDDQVSKVIEFQVIQ